MNLPAGNALIPAGGEVRLLAGVLLRRQQVRMQINDRISCDAILHLRLRQTCSNGPVPIGPHERDVRNQRVRIAKAVEILPA